MKPELMVPVERAVRPVFAHHVRKMRMREELYSLIEQRYEDNRSQGQSEDEATRTAIEAFGDPREIQEQLQATISRITWFAKWWDDFIIVKSRPAMLRDSVRCGICLGVPLTLFMLAMSLALLFLKQDRTAIILTPMFLTLGLIYGVNACQVNWFGSRAWLAWRGGQEAAAAGYTLIMGLMTACSFAVLYLFAGWDAFLDSGWQRALIAFPATIIVFLLASWQISIERRQREPWDAVDVQDRGDATTC